MADINTLLIRVTTSLNNFAKDPSFSVHQTHVSSLLVVVDYIGVTLLPIWNHLDASSKSHFLGLLNKGAALLFAINAPTVGVFIVVGVVFYIIETLILYFELSNKLKGYKEELERIHKRFVALIEVFLNTESKLTMESFLSVLDQLEFEMGNLIPHIDNDARKAINMANQLCGLCGQLFGWEDLRLGLEKAKRDALNMNNRFSTIRKDLKNVSEITFKERLSGTLLILEKY